METRSGAVRLRSRRKDVKEMGAEPNTKKHKTTGHVHAGDTTLVPPPPPPIGLPESDSNRTADKGLSVLKEGTFDRKISGKGYPFPEPGLKLEVPRIGVITRELREWVDDYLDWKPSNLWKDPFPIYTGPPPPIPPIGDPKVRAKIKCADERLHQFKGVAEDAVEFYKKQHPCADLEAVEILNGRVFRRGRLCEEIIFTAKPKTAADDDNGCLLTLSAELVYGEPTGDAVFDLFCPGEFSHCVPFRGRDKDFYQGCPFYCGVDHPPELLLPYVSVPVHLQGRYSTQDRKFPLKAFGSAVRLAATGK